MLPATEAADGHNSRSDPDLHVRLELAPGALLAAGPPTAAFVYGSCFHARQRVDRVRLLVDGAAVTAAAQRMPRLDVFRGAPDAPSYRSGFWAYVPLGERRAEAEVELRVEASLGDGSVVLDAPRLIRVEAARALAGGAPELPGPDGVAICMATHEPDMALFERQIDSIRGQSLESWVCVISDDCSSSARLAEMQSVLGNDPRFALVPSDRRLGFYRNFERALRLAPAEARYLALADQDDRWRPEKLEVLLTALGSAQLVYSDARIVDAGGTVLSSTYWTRRRTNHTNLASLLVANTITGAASLFRRDVLDLALPFPDPPGRQYHDHWIGTVALASGEIAYVDRPLYDYVQHGSAALGHTGANVVATDRRARAVELRRLGITGARRFVAGWRTSYFYDYCRLRVLAEVLMMRCGPALEGRKRRALRLFIAAERSPLAFLWLTVRSLRRLVGADETIGAERLLARGVLWRHLVALVALGRERPLRWPRVDASLPASPVDATRQDGPGG